MVALVNATVFDSAWLARAKATPHKASWITDFLDSLDVEGTLYLDSIRIWFNRFPHASATDRNALKSRLEQFNNTDHLGGVNELCRWEFMRKAQLTAEPVGTATAPRPDFHVVEPVEFYVEVSTVNVSKTGREQFEKREGVPLDHSKILSRMLRKAAECKRDQIAFGANLKQPAVLVLFD